MKNQNRVHLHVVLNTQFCTLYLIVIRLSFSVHAGTNQRQQWLFLPPLRPTPPPSKSPPTSLPAHPLMKATHSHLSPRPPKNLKNRSLVIMLVPVVARQKIFSLKLLYQEELEQISLDILRLVSLTPSRPRASSNRILRKDHTTCLEDLLCRHKDHLIH